MPIAQLSPAHLSPIDLTIVAFYLVAITLFGLSFSRKAKGSSKGSEKSLKSYFLADNTIPWWAIALSIVSAETSTLTIISIPGVAFAGDLGFLQVVLGYMLGRIVVALLFLPRYFRGEMLTAYQLIDQRFGHTLHKVTAGLFLLTRAAAEGVRVFAISIVVGIAIGTGDILSIALISALTLLYTFEGGMAAVIWTDVVQMGLYVAGTLVALWSLGHHVPGGWSYIHLIGSQSAKFRWLDFSFTLTKSYTFWAGLLGGTFLTMASHGTDQLMVQRMLAARNLRESRLALLSSGLVIFLQFTLFLLIGVGLFVFYGLHPQVFSTADRIFPTFIVQQMPHGIAGLLVAAILAAAMSNLSAALNSLASTSVIDFYLPFVKSRVPHDHPPSGGLSWVEPPSTPPPSTTLPSRLFTVFWAVVLFAIAVYSIHAGGKGHVVETGLSIASVAYGSLLGVFLLGTLTRFATERATILAMLCGFLLNLALWQSTLAHPFLPMPFLPKIAFTWYVLIGSLVTFALGSLFSLLTPRRRPALAVLLVLALSSFASAQNRVPHPSRGFTREGWGIGEADRSSDISPSAPDFSPISTLINEAIAAHKLPGAVVVIGHNGKVVFEHAYGGRALEPTVEPMTEDTIFDMASLTKVLVTTTAILQLYEQHKLDLDAPVAKYLPEFADPPKNLSSFAAGGGPASRPSPQTLSSFAAGKGPAFSYKSLITIRQLLTHYSGLPEDVDLKDPWGLTAPDKAEGIRRALAAVPYGPPGLTFKYSDINFITLGAVAEKISGQPLDVYARQHIFDPLGMTPNFTTFLPVEKACGPKVITGTATSIPSKPETPDSPFYADFSCAGWIPENYIDRTAPTAHDDQGTALTNPNFDHLLRGTVHDPTTRRMGGVAGHAGVFSTAEDASRFCDALLAKLIRNTGPFPLSQATLRLATSPNEPATAVGTATIFTPSGETTKGIASHGLGWDLNTAYSRPRGTIFPITTRDHPGSFGHTGFTGTSLWLDPTSDTYVILLSNAIHIPHTASISTLRGAVATAAAHALGLDSSDTPSFAASAKDGLSGAARAASFTPALTRPSEPGPAQSKNPEEPRPTPTAENLSTPSLGAPSFAACAKGGVSGEARPPSFTPALTRPSERGAAHSKSSGERAPVSLHAASSLVFSDKRIISAEDDDTGTVPAPEGILRTLAKNPTVKRVMRNESPALALFPPNWVQCYPVHLGAKNETDYVVMGIGPLLGANVTSFWVYRLINEFPVLVMQAPEFAIELLKTRHNGLLDIQLSSATAVTLNEVILRFDGRRYVRSRSSLKALSGQSVDCQHELCQLSLIDFPNLSTAKGTARQLPSPTQVRVPYDHPPSDKLLWAASPSTLPTLTGIDVLEQTHFAALKDLATHHGNPLRLGLLTNQSSLDASGHRTIDILAHASPELELKSIFAPEHGLLAHQDTDRLAAETDPATHIPVIAVFGPKASDKRPKQSDLKQLDAVVIDLQDAGTRFWTYETLTGYFLEACAQAHVEVIVLDRPNPLGGLAVQGPTSDVGLESYTDFMPLPLRHGLTLGELARYFNANATAVQLKPELLDARTVHIGDETPETKPPATLPGLHASLTVIPMQNWTRSVLFADTGLTWTPPSPNLKSPAAAILYPAVGLTEQTNLSVGRGTLTPFENLGAPWLDSAQIKAADLAAYLTERKIPGIEITPTTLTIADTSEKYPGHGQTIPGIHFHVTDPAAFDSPEFGIEILSALHHLYPADFKLDLVRNLLASAETLSALKSGQDPRDIAALWSPSLRRFQQARQPFLLYP